MLHVLTLFHDKAAVLYSAKDTGVLVETLHIACAICACFFRAKSSVSTSPNLEWCTAFEIKLPQSLTLHALTLPDLIWVLFQSRAVYMAINMFVLVFSNARCGPWIMQFSPTSGDHIVGDIAKQHDQRYTKHPTILKFLSETTTMPSNTSKHLWVDFCRSSEETERENHVRANTWF